MLKTSYRLAVIWGIPIKIHISLILLFVVMASLLIAAGGLSELVRGSLLIVCVFTSVALHELGHSFVAIRKGCRVREITLMAIGGAAQMEAIPTRPKDEILMAVAGPLVSVIIGGLCLLSGLYLPLEPSLWPLPFVRQTLVRCNFVEFVGLFNLGLACFNMIPSFPMDGGRVLRALLSRKWGRLRATRIAARIGQGAALLFLVLAWHLNDLILPFIAVFIFIAADREYRLVRLQEAAQQQASPFWPFQVLQGGKAEAEDKVVISPPPYRRGPDSESDLRVQRRRNPFADFFGH